MNQNVPGCNLIRWDYHAANGEFDACLQAYADEVVNLDQSTYRKVLLGDLNSPRIKHIVLVINPAFDEKSTESSACFYHRACRSTLRFGEETKLWADIGVEDINCDLDLVSVSLKPLNHVLTGHRDFTVKADSEQEQACTKALLEGRQYTYTFRHVLKSATLTASLGELKFGGSIRLSIFAEDRAKHEAANWGENEEAISGAGYRFLDQVNLAIEQDRAHLSNYLARGTLEHAGKYLQYLVNRAATGGTETEMGLARARATDGIRRFDEVMKWFDSSFEDALYRCDLPGPLQPHEVAACPEIREQLQKALGGRVRVIAGSAAAGDLLRPIVDALGFATQTMFETGFKQRYVQELVYKAFGPAFGLQYADHQEQTFWDWFVSANASPDPSDSCERTSGIVAAARAADRIGPGLRLNAVLRYEEALRGMPGAHSGLDLHCLQRALDENGVKGPDSTHPALGAIEAVNLLASVHDLGRNGIGSVGMLSIAWLVFERAVRYRNDDATALAWLEAGCILVSVVGLTATANPILLFFTFVGIGACTKPRNTPKDAQGYVENRASGASYYYAVDTFPDVPDARPEAERGLGSQGLVRIRLMDFPIVRGKGFSVACGDATVEVSRYAFNFKVDRLVGGTWQHEASMRFAGSPVITRNTRDPDQVLEAFWFSPRNPNDVSPSDPVADREEETDWRVSYVNKLSGLSNVHQTLEATYFGSPVPGLRRVTIIGVPDINGHPWDRDVVADFTADGTVGSAARSPPAARNTHPSLEPGLLSSGCSGAPQLVSRISVLRGVAWDFRARVPDSKVVIEDLRSGPGLTHEFRAKVVPTGPGYHYYWDLGDLTTTANATTDPSAIYKWRFQPGTQEVRLTVVDGRGVVVAEGTHRFTAEPVLPQVRLGASRIGDQLTLSGFVTHEDTCLAYTLTLRDELLSSSPSCMESASNYRFSVERVVSLATLPVGSTAVLRVSGGGQPETVRSIGVAAQPNPNLNAGPAEGQFFGTYTEVDSYRYTVPSVSSPSSLTFKLISAGRFRWTVEGPGTRVHHEGRGELVVGAGMALAGTTWTVRVESLNNQGCYVLSVDDQQAPSSCFPASFCIGAGCSDRGELSVPRDKKVYYVEGFEAQPQGWTTRSSEGTGVWHASRYKAFMGSTSAHVGQPAKRIPVYDERKESDTLLFKIPAGDMGAAPGKPMKLRFMEWNQVQEWDQQHLRGFLVICSGKKAGGGTAWDYVGSKSFQDPKVIQWREQAVQFSCGSSRITSGFTVWVQFTFKSGPNTSLPCHLLALFGGRCTNQRQMPGWFVDNVILHEA